MAALHPVVESKNGTWVGWDGGSGDPPRKLENLNLEPIRLSRKLIDDYYYGFSNRSLWPLLHDLVGQPVFDRRLWGAYQRANRTFADVQVKENSDGNSPLLWVHDYQLMLLPELLRERWPQSPIGFYLHTPFPAPELFSRLPWAEDLLRGMLGAHLIAFQTEDHRDNFVRASRALSGVKATDDRIAFDGRVVQAVARPISIDVKSYTTAAASPSVEREVARLRRQFAGRRILLGVDRLDYTKGILERLRALQLLFERRPSLVGEVAFLQIAVPSRDDVKEYRDLREEVEAEVGRINGRFTEPGHDVPVHYFYRAIPFHRLLAYYRAADIAVVTPLKDGMNLIAKEYIICQAAGDGRGTLVLSQFAGAASELAEAVICNPFDVEGLSNSIEQAIDMPREESADRLETMASRIQRHDVFAWGDEILRDIESASTQL